MSAAEPLPRVEGAAADFLAAERERLNARFKAARRRWPRLEPRTVLAAMARVLPPLAGPEPGARALLDAVVGLIFLHEGRGGLASRPGIESLFVEAFPALRSLLLREPRVLPAELSNAVENLGPRGGGFARDLVTLAPLLQSPDALRGAGVLRAWRLGLAPLRAAALGASAGLPPEVVLAALGFAGWPAAAAPLVLAALRGSAWRDPRACVTARDLEAAARGEPLGERCARLADPRPGAWAEVARVGGFAGFDGDFLAPPRVLSGGGLHRIRLQSGAETFQIVADVFGWTCHLAPPEPGDEPRRPGRIGLGGLFTPGVPFRTDGSLVLRDGGGQLPELAGATSFGMAAGRLAVSLPQTYRIAVVVRIPEPS